MRSFIIVASLLAALLVTPAAYAAGFGSCKGDIAKSIDHEGFTGQLIAPVQPIAQVVKLTDDLLVFAVTGPASGDSSYDSALDLHRADFANVFDALSNPKQSSAWVGVANFKDKDGGDNGLWLWAWVDTPNGCISGQMGSQVYWLRDNAPRIFSSAMSDWEDKYRVRRLVVSEP